MKFLKAILFYLVVISEMNCVFSLLNKTVPNSIGGVKGDNTLCTTDKCVMKCCPFGKVINYKIVTKKTDKTKKRKIMICDNYPETRNIASLNSDKTFYNKPDLSTYEVKSGIFETNKTFMYTFTDIVDAYFNIHLNEHGEVLLEIPNAYDRWIHVPNNMFCWEYSIVNVTKVTTNNNTNINTISFKPGIWVQFQAAPDESKQTGGILMTTAMLLSSVFLFLVLVVYALLPELRTLGGLILMAYVASLLGAFLFLAVMRVSRHEPFACLSLTFLIYFFFMASFCWMNVMSIDIWWTFRGYAKARAIHRRGERFKFLMYCLYAWGLPLAMTIVLAVLNSSDMTHIPWFVTPKINKDTCFFKAGEQFIYLYIPMLGLILCNWTFYLMTAFNIWRLSRGTAVLDSAAAGSPQAHRSQRRRFMVYLKLSIVMGLNWLLEVLSSFYPNSSVWYLSDFYNILIGVSIFIIFVCKRKIIKKIKKLFTRNSQWQPDHTHSKETTTSSSDGSGQDTQETQHVCYNPKGSTIAMKSV